jgi:hypothetical protein
MRITARPMHTDRRALRTTYSPCTTHPTLYLYLITRVYTR